MGIVNRRNVSTVIAPASTPAALPTSPDLEVTQPADRFDTPAGNAGPRPDQAPTPPSEYPVRPDLAAEAIAMRNYALFGGGTKAANLTISRSQDGSVLIRGTNDNDQIRVTPRADGKPGVDVTAGKNVLHLSDEEAKKLTIDAGAGNDQILVDAAVSYPLTLKGGDGDDLIRAGSGDTHIDGGAGRDVLYGGSGNDTIDGGDGNDVINGGAGNDIIRGGAGDDLIYGGDGDDTITGGSGKNVIADSSGQNKIANANGDDTVYAQKSDQVGKLKGAQPGTVKRVDVSADAKPAGSSIKIEGSPEFKAKVQTEIDALRATPTGRALLKEIDSHPDKPVVIKEGKNQAFPNDEADAMPKGITVTPKDKPSVTGTGKGTGSTVTFDPDLYRAGNGDVLNTPADADDPMTVAPTIALFHELVHAARSQNGESAGLTMKEEYETAGTKDADDLKQFGWRFNENQLRKELNQPQRVHYEE